MTFISETLTLKLDNGGCESPNWSREQYNIVMPFHL